MNEASFFSTSSSVFVVGCFVDPCHFDWSKIKSKVVLVCNSLIARN